MSGPIVCAAKRLAPLIGAAALSILEARGLKDTAGELANLREAVLSDQTSPLEPRKLAEAFPLFFDALGELAEAAEDCAAAGCPADVAAAYSRLFEAREAAREILGRAHWKRPHQEETAA
jgi:hypothetical protein